MTDLGRREMVELLALAPLAGALRWTPVEADRALRGVRSAGSGYEPRFFTAHEWETVRALVDLILPADERSGSATEAGVPEFIDYIVADEAHRQTAMRGGLAWMDIQCRKRFGRDFVACADAERRALLDDVAWPRRARPEMAHGVAFFSSVRDLTASGFFSSAMGMEDVGYQGNTVVTEWTGCPEPQLRKLGVRYD